MRILAGLALLLVSLHCAPAPETEDRSDAPAVVETARQIFYPEAFAPGRAFSPGVLAGDTLYLAGQVDKDPKTGEQPEGVAAQTKLTMENVGHILEAAGLTFSHLVSCRVQLDDMDNYAEMNGVYGSFFEEGRYPARTTLEMPALVGGAHIEVSCIGYRDAAGITVVRPDPSAIPPAMGPYSPAVMAGDTLYVSGQGGRNPQTGAVAEAAGDQAAQTLETIGHILAAAELDASDVVFADVYYPGPGDLAAIDDPFMAAFEAGAAPSRGVFELSALPGGIKVEITFLASRDKYSVTRLFEPGEQPTSTVTPATLAGDTLYVSAISAGDAGVSVEQQFRAVIAEHQARLALADMDLANVVNANVYLADTADFAAMDAVFREYFPENPPARTTVGVRSSAKVQVGLTAVR